MLYRVKDSAALDLFPIIVRRLQVAPPGALDADVADGFREWAKTDLNGSDVAALLAKIAEAHLSRVKQQRPDDTELHEYIRSEEEEFTRRWERIRRYSWNICFEFAFLALLILVFAWPWLTNAGPVQWAACWGLMPVLIFVPFWLGYAPLTFTSADSGGILYPELLRHFGGGQLTSLDRVLLRHLPQLLEPLSQTPGPMMSFSRTGAVGPTKVLALSLAVAVSVFAVGRWSSWAEVRRGYK
jgi:hypothetical protein